MSVLVKGMKMPTSCSDCEMCYDMMECCVAEPIINFFRVKEFDFCTERHPRCPLSPADDVRPVVKAEWVRCGDGENTPYMCSHCGKTSPANLIEKWTPNLCPNCGADMRGKNDEAISI